MRAKLPDRRNSVNLPIVFASSSGRDQKILVTLGVDESLTVREVFCADFKAGSDNHALVMDACILLSRLLQHGDTPVELVASMCSPPSLIGRITLAIAEHQEWLHAQLKSVGVPKPSDPPPNSPMPLQNGREATRLQGYLDDACPDCGNLTLVRNGTCLKCNSCGSTSGCS